MRLEDRNESDNVEDRRGGGIGLGGLGLGGVVLALVISYFSGIDPSTVLNVMNGASVSTRAPAHKPPADDSMARFVSKVLASTEAVWGEVFRQSGKTYVDPKLVLFTGSTPTACGTGQTAAGPFYWYAATPGAS